MNLPKILKYTTKVSFYEIDHAVQDVKRVFFEGECFVIPALR